ncbi:coiled-coil domain-containing protein 166 isoform X3 [Rhea pennata]|uniref:coiled-coil domain-containing protein 166 isoform X3 n=1 Tax=Rhea pennata TaxID=8795 RepID=UPI002E2773DB
MPGTAVLSEVSPRDGCFAPLLHPKHTHTRPGNLRRAQITASRSPAPARAPQHRHDRLKRTGSDQAPARTDLLIGESSDLPPKSGRQETQRCNADQRYLCQGEREVNLWIGPGEVPEDWKKASVTAVSKDKKEDPGNYRPVSLTSIPGKLITW